MYHIRQRDLPFRGSSYNFVGADNGDVNVSVFLFHGQPGAGPGAASTSVRRNPVRSGRPGLVGGQWRGVRKGAPATSS
jgi:hypothetical protein